ncbi:MAG: gliding motility-associated-like protein [Marinoscillum sp.]|jgi:gliding motility-associated-like protein
MKKIFLFVLLAGFVFSGQAFHIVGGEIEFITLQAGRYQINLIQYKDEAQTENDQYDQSVRVAMFSNKDNRQVGSFVLFQQNISTVNYTNEECAIAELQTSRIIFTETFDLNPEDFQDIEGYYFVWERCCRNAVTKNIVNPDGTGMKYVLEIPPLWKDDQPFINSSPVLLKPLSDYACINQLYYTNFTGTDPDGDSLVYRLATPLNSSSADALPIPSSKPHLRVNWNEGFSLSNSVPGSPSLNISPRGLLTVKPFDIGVYVFSVVVEEWREKVKIGEVQRDFQMLVVDGCNPPEPPKVTVQIPGNLDFNPSVDTLYYSLTDDRKFDFIITNIKAGETIRLRAEPVNFSKELDNLFSIDQAFVKSGQDTLIVSVTAPGCPPIRDAPFIIDLIASDDACPLPQLDTARLVIYVESPPNDLSVLSNTPPGITLNENDSRSIDFTATDADMDSLTLSLIVPGVINPAILGVSLDITTNRKGLIEATLNWDTNCQLYDFNKRPNFLVGIQVEDLDQCEEENEDIRWINMSVILPPNTRPIITSNTDEILSLSEGDFLDLIIQTTDADNDTIDLILINSEALAKLGVIWKDTLGKGSVSSSLQWQIDCVLISESSKREFEFEFRSEDYDRCDIKNADTLKLKVSIQLDENTPPVFEFVPDRVLEINVPFEITLRALDIDANDIVSIEWFNAARLPRSPSLELIAENGPGQSSATLRWTPECSLLDFGQPSKFIDLIFLTYDDGCPQRKLDTMKIVFEVRETRDYFADFEPANVFTPNGDGNNDSFRLTNLPIANQNLPPDNCEDAFQSIIILDRTGSKVYESANRDFNWAGDQKPTGVYYYLIQFERTQYKGWVQLLR